MSASSFLSIFEDRILGEKGFWLQPSGEMSLPFPRHQHGERLLQLAPETQKLFTHYPDSPSTAPEYGALRDWAEEAGWLWGSLSPSWEEIHVEGRAINMRQRRALVDLSAEQGWPVKANLKGNSRIITVESVLQTLADGVRYVNPTASEIRDAYHDQDAHRGTMIWHVPTGKWFLTSEDIMHATLQGYLRLDTIDCCNFYCRFNEKRLYLGYNFYGQGSQEEMQNTGRHLSYDLLVKDPYFQLLASSGWVASDENGVWDGEPKPKPELSPQVQDFFKNMSDEDHDLLDQLGD